MTVPTVGDLIEVLDMPDDPAPIPRGTRGRVVRVNPVDPLGFTQVWVEWEIDRSLMLSIPPDQVRVIEEGDSEK